MVRLSGLDIGDDPDGWRALGFALDSDGAFVVGGVRLRVAPTDESDGRGVRSWALTGAVAGDLDGLTTVAAGDAVGCLPAEHPNGATALDHVVIATPDLERTMAAFSAGGLRARRVRDAGRRRQAFYVLGTALAEVVGPTGTQTAGAPGADRPARFWGLTFAVADLDAAAAQLPDVLGDAGEAVQAGRRIATVRGAAGLAVPVAFMSPRQ